MLGAFRSSAHDARTSSAAKQYVVLRGTSSFVVLLPGRQLRLAIVTWIERTYHRRRRQRALGRLTPIEFETINRAAHAA